MNDRAWIDDFVACFDVVDQSDLRIEQAYLIKDANLPPRLFKFRAVTKNALKNLIDGTVWMASPTNYNDPYDCAATISSRELSDVGYANLPDELREPLLKVADARAVRAAETSPDPLTAFLRLLLAGQPGMTEDKIEPMANALRTASETVMQRYLDRTMDRSRDAIRMCSFSERNDATLMWSHYGAEHTGFCIEYETARLQSAIRRQTYPVIYDQKRFDATKYHRSVIATDAPFNNLLGVLQALYKAPEWAYEQEWRLVFNHGLLDQSQAFAIGRPSRIYLGALISDRNRRKVTRICDEKGIPVQQMALSRTEYRMEPSPYIPPRRGRRRKSS